MRKGAIAMALRQRLQTGSFNRVSVVGSTQKQIGYSIYVLG